MRKISVLSAAASLLFTATAMANGGTTEPIAPAAKVCTEIGHRLADNNIVLAENEEVSAMVRFTVNDENEIVVLNVRTENETIENFVKAKLNYHSIADSGLESGVMYEVPVRFRS